MRRLYTAVEMTPEDVSIWVNLRTTGYAWASLMDMSDWQDNTDAQLMLRTLQVRQRFELLRKWIRGTTGWAPLGAHSIMIGAQTKGVDVADAFRGPMP